MPDPKKMDQIRAQAKKQKLKDAMTKNALMGGERIPKFISKKTSRGTRKRLNPEYKAIYGSANLKNRPLKIDNKGLTPNVQVKKKVEVEKKTPVKTETRAEMLKRKTGSTYDPTKANRAGQRMGQRKAGGMIKKMKGGGMAMKYGHGGKVGKKCPRDGIVMRGKTRA